MAPLPFFISFGTLHCILASREFFLVMSPSHESTLVRFSPVLGSSHSSSDLPDLECSKHKRLMNGSASSVMPESSSRTLPRTVFSKSDSFRCLFGAILNCT